MIKNISEMFKDTKKDKKYRQGRKFPDSVCRKIVWEDSRSDEMATEIFIRLGSDIRSSKNISTME